MERQPKKGLSQRSAEKEKVSRDQKKESQGASAKDYEHVYRLSVNNNVGSREKVKETGIREHS